jgi:uncharacterized membrane protein YeaQ/YmgE (transglycosylase-associated protein family)
MVLGIIGAVVGGVLFNLAGSRGAGEFGLWSILVAFVGATVLTLLLQAISGSRSGRRSW